ncbi:hypothetical protein ABPG73_007742 [Tetrahymena malaccensis]
MDNNNPNRKYLCIYILWKKGEYKKGNQQGFQHYDSDSDEDNQDANSLENQSQNQENLIKVFFVIEQEFCQSNLDTFFVQCRKSNNYPPDKIKEIMMIQMLDSVAYLHRFDVVHRDIKPSNFLLSFNQNDQPMLKLCDLSFATALQNNQSRISFSKFKGTQSYSAPEVDKGIFKKASDMFSLGLVLLELDNISTFDFTKTTNEQKFDIKFGNIFTSFQINRQSQIYRIASQCLQFDPRNRISPVDLLIQFILQNQNYLDVEISSVLNKKQLQKQAQQLSKIQKSIIENSKKQEIELLQISQIYKDQKLEKLIQEFKQLKDKPFEIFEYQIILDLLSKKTQFDSNFEFISVGATGLILGTYNKLQKRYSALKIQRVLSKHEVALEVGIMRDCQMPLVVKFYDFFYLDVSKKDDFVVYEIEKCSGKQIIDLKQKQLLRLFLNIIGNLKQYFNRLKKDKIQLSDEEKMQIAIQVIDVINYLHYHDIVHRDVKLENILYIDSQSQVPIIKLTDFDQARKVYYYKILVDGDLIKDYKPIKGACGTLGYISPEIFNTFLYTFQSEIFSLGVCLALIDNFETLEPHLKEKNLDILHEFKIPFEPSYLVKNELIKRDTKIYDIVVNTVTFSQQKRKNLSYIVANLEKQGYQFYSKVYTSTKNIASSFSYYRIAELKLIRNHMFLIQSQKLGPNGAKAVASEIAKCPTLSTLTLDLDNSNIGPDGAKAVASEIAKCPTLSTLTLDLQSNNIGPDGAKAVASEIAKCPTLSTLTLWLQSNNIGPDGAKAVASEIAKCPTLSTLTLWLYNNNIGPDGAKAVASEIAKCPTLSTLTLDLQSNNIGPDGAKAVASEIAKCPTLSTLTLSLYNNNIGPDGAKAVASEIAKCPTLSTLTLDLQSNNIGPDGAKAVASEIAKCPTLSTLTLWLYNNNIGPDGAKAVASEIAKCPTLSTLTLDLDNNNIGPDGAKAVASEIAKCPTLSTLSLDLRNNKLSEIKSLESEFPQNMIVNIKF